MSAVRRLASGNIAGFVSIFANLVATVTLVPIFLHFWRAEDYGLWLGLTTAIAFITLLDNAHLDYLGFECMKAPRADLRSRNQILSDALPALAIAAVVEMLTLVAFLASPLTPRVFGVAPNSPDLPMLRWSLGGMMLAWILLQLPIGLLGRGLTSVGHYAATVWWYLVNGIVQAVVPAAAVAFGADLTGASLAYILGTVVTQILCAFHYRTLARREGLRVCRPDVTAGLRRTRGGLALGASSLLEFLQQAGFRLVLLPFLGAIRLVQFSTMRTVANVVQQGFVVLVNPVLPELMHYVSARDRLRTGMTTTAMFYITVLLMCPGFVMLQAVVRPLFAIWTQGKVGFDEPVFAALSCAVLIAGLTQASRAIVRGNNLVVAQGMVSLLTGLGLLVITFLTTRWLGLLGAALGLVAAEATRAALYFVLALRWFDREGFPYPRNAAATAIGCTLATIAALAVMAIFPNAENIIALAYLPAWLGMNLLFWLAMSLQERAFAAAVMMRYLPRRLAHLSGGN